MSHTGAPHSSTNPAPVSLEPTRRSTRRGLILFVVLLIIALVIGTVGIVSRRHSHAVLSQHTESAELPVVAVDTAVPGEPVQEVILPGTIQAFKDAPIYARTNGYVKSWHYDIGSHVRKGELLAVIEAPEIDRQVDQARAALTTAQANLRLSRVTAQRYQGLMGSDAVSKQSIDTAVDNASAQQSMVATAQQSLNQLLEMQSFEHVTAPFDGTVTARNIDVGQLVDSGSSGGTGSVSSLSGNTASGTGTGPRELFHISSLSIVRIFVNVPEVDTPEARPGVKADIDVAQYPGRVFNGIIVRTADAEDLSTRTLMAEVDIDNRSGDLLPGAYAQVHLKLLMKHPALIIPVSSLLFRAQGLQVVTLNNQNRTHLQVITVGRDWGTRIEVLTGLTPGERIVDSPPDSVTENEEVRVVNGSKTEGGEGGQI